MTKTIIAIALLIGIAHAENGNYSDKGYSEKMIYNPYHPLAEDTTHYDKAQAENTLSKPYYPATTKDTVSDNRSK